MSVSSSGRSSYIPPTFNVNYSRPSSPFSASKAVASPTLRNYEGPSPADYESPGHRNTRYTVLFLTHLLAFLGVSIYYINRFRHEVPTGQFEWGMGLFDTVICIGGTAGMAACSGAVFAFLWLRFSYHAHSTRGRFVIFSVVATALSYTAAAVFMVVRHEVTAATAYLGVVLLSLLIFTLLNYKDFSFSQVLIQVSFRALTQYWGVLVISALALTVSFFVGTYYYMALLAMHVIVCFDTGHNLYWLSFLWVVVLLSAFWTQKIIMDVTHVTTTGAVGTYWYSTYIPCEALSSFKRALGCSFGSIIKASLVIPVSEVAQVLTCFSRKKNRGWYCVAPVRNLAREANRFAYTQIALYGLTFTKASTHGYDVFSTRGHCQMLQHNMTDSAVNISSLMGALMSLLAGGLPAYNSYVDTPECPYAAALLLMAYAVGFVSAKLVLRQLSASVNTTLTIFAQDYDIMAVNRPEVLEVLENARAKRFPGGNDGETEDENSIMMINDQEEVSV